MYIYIYIIYVIHIYTSQTNASGCLTTYIRYTYINTLYMYMYILSINLSDMCIHVCVCVDVCMYACTHAVRIRPNERPQPPINQATQPMTACKRTQSAPDNILCITERVLRRRVCSTQVFLTAVEYLHITDWVLRVDRQREAEDRLRVLVGVGRWRCRSLLR